MPDLTIQFHRSQWDNLPVDVQVWIGRLCGPLYPDAKGVLTMTLSEERWAEIQRMIEKHDAP